MPEPDRLRVLKGGGARRQPAVVSGAGDCPDWLPVRAREMWERVVPELERLELVGRVDLAVLEAFCCDYATWRKAVELVQAEGVLVDGARGVGERVRHPATLVAQAASDRLRAGAVQLGLSPAARLRMTLPEPGGDLEAEQVFGRVPAGRRAR